MITAAVEGFIDEAVVARLTLEAGLSIQRVLGGKGKNHLHKGIGAYNKAARFAPWFVLVDLDHGHGCAPALVQDWVPDAAPYLCFRVAVRAVEAWILSDRERIAEFLHIGLSQVPKDPEGLDDPKRCIVDLARRSRRPQIRKELAPRENSSASEGPTYAARMAEFITERWRPEVAVQRSDSLRRCREALRTQFEGDGSPSYSQQMIG